MRKRIKKLIDFSFSSNATVVLFVEILIGIFLILITTFFLADLTKDTLIDNTITEFDRRISQTVYALRTPSLTQFMVFISWLGADFILAVSTVIMIFFTWRKHKSASTLFLIMLLFGALLNLLLKEIFQRPRPTFDPLFILGSYSFPSGHAMNSFVFYATITYFYYHFTKKIRSTIFLAFVALALISSIGISRIYLGVHYPSDVLAGYLTGLLWFILVLVLDRTMTFFRLYSSYTPKN
ncbi:MAG: hypothetical protein RLZZ455_17 [Candidatus Parcubacteria bacterium]|jgi:undecaprenyl-diphosphatase